MWREILHSLKGRIWLCFWVVLRVMNYETRLVYLCLTGLLKWLYVIKESACVHIVSITQEIPHRYRQQNVITVWWKSLSSKHPGFPISSFLWQSRLSAVEDLSFQCCLAVFFSVTWVSSQAHKVFNKWCLFNYIFLKHPDERELRDGEQYWPFNDWTVGRMIW